jgi:hypothetical protein
LYFSVFTFGRILTTRACALCCAPFWRLLPPNTNLNISEGEYAKPGVPIFTLIDNRTWYVVSNYRESELKSIRPGKQVDVYVMSQPSQRFDGIVESLGFALHPMTRGSTTVFPTSSTP